MKKWMAGWDGEWKDAASRNKGGDLFLNIMTFIVCLYFLLGTISITGIHSVSSPSSSLKEG